ncbi:hypothetical protein [Nitratiruptor sp. SB155-2]|uniref:hypothetical protein n=1 Tax=Nitratiruptor sp. (strain SB155-2) TaxID=387092 RepID=UPI00059BB1C2|nr:hypothetical protein [Nitratiruptor sp. SB155-2]
MARVNKKKPFRPRCRYCRTNKHVIPIIYGKNIDETLLEKENLGEVKIGGVARSVDAPNWHCKECGNEFLR